MALLGHHTVDQGLARLLQALRPAPLRTAEPRKLKRGQPGSFDPNALAMATAMYGGGQSLSAQSFASAEWLETFALSGRQLLMCHALRLLQGWVQVRRKLGHLENECALLETMVRNAGSYTATLDHALLTPLSQAIELQIKRVTQVKAANATQMRVKAMALMSAAATFEDGASLQATAARLLQQALPHLIQNDGGPSAEGLFSFVPWVTALVANPDLLLEAETRHALDRALSFLAMLHVSDGQTCFGPAISPPRLLNAVPALGLAPNSATARIQSGKTVVISVSSQINGSTAICVVNAGHTLLKAHVFFENPEDDQTVTELTCEQSEQGTLLEQQSEAGHRSLFLAPKGEDIRVEDRPKTSAPRLWMRLDINRDAKVSIARNRTLLTMALDGRQLWELSLRGATILPQTADGLWYVETRQPVVNWAFKKRARATQRSNNPQMAELPF
jgi:hypothetical protein